MSDIAIKVENLSKLYQLGSIGTGTLRNDLQRWWAYVKGKEDPFTKIGQVNDRAKKAESDFVWALKDIDFEVKKGEVLGIIGRNGAGKSTLLKILSKITSPTNGKIMVDGRIASLLEVGTGFHPELTGRENIFMNGAILGMRKWEIQKKFDEIVDFSGVEAYIDTPVKRYSSGMYVRLAFAVAAFLEPEILIVDEVLAVGDAEFQKKCIGRMKDVSVNDGRTVVFVSHNLSAVQKLCDRVIFFRAGGICYDSDTKSVIDKYLEDTNAPKQNHYLNEKVNDKTDILEIKLMNDERALISTFNFNKKIRISFKLKIASIHVNSIFGFKVKDQFEQSVFSSEIVLRDFISNEGIYVFEVEIPDSILAPNNYQVQVAIHIPNKEIISLLENAVGFEILKAGSTFLHYEGADYGCVLINCKWERMNFRNEGI